MNNIESNNNNIINFKKKKIDSNYLTPLTKEEEELLYLINKSSIANKILLADLDIFKYNEFDLLKKRNLKHEKNNQKLLAQIGIISNKIYKEKSPEIVRNRQLFHDLLYNNTDNNDNSFLEKNKNYKNKVNKSQSIKKGLLPKIIKSEKSEKKLLNQINYSKKRVITNNNENIISNSENNNNIEGISLANAINNIEDIDKDKNKNKKFYYVFKNNKNIKKKLLPPINKQLFKLHRLKLNVNNIIDPTDQKHEDMMNMYKEIEYKNKHRFVV